MYLSIFFLFKKEYEQIIPLIRNENRQQQKYHKIR